MKTVYFTRHGGPEVLQIADAPIPQPAPGEVLIRMAAAGVGKPDYLMRTGAYPWTRDILPFYPGLYGTGTVAALGDGVTDFSVGQGVFVDHPVVCGCYSEYKTAPAELVAPLPEGIDLVSAAAVNNHVIAWSLLHTACAPGQGRTLYMKSAAGALGSAIVQLAPLCGLTVIASASTEEKCAHLRKLGAAHVFCYKTEDEEAAVLAATDGLGADYILDQVVGADFTRQFAYLNRGGTVVIYNTLGGFPPENLPQFLTDNFAKCWAVRAFSFHKHDGHPDEHAALRREVFSMLAEGKFTPAIAAAIPQSDIVRAHALMDAGTALGSIVLTL